MGFNFKKAGMKISQRTGKNIRLFRHAHQMHQRVLAINTAIPIKVLQKIEKGEMGATEDQLERIAKEFDTQIFCLQMFDFDTAVSLFMRHYHEEQLKEYPSQGKNTED